MSRPATQRAFTFVEFMIIVVVLFMLAAIFFSARAKKLSAESFKLDNASDEQVSVSDIVLFKNLGTEDSKIFTADTPYRVVRVTVDLIELQSPHQHKMVQCTREHILDMGSRNVIITVAHYGTPEHKTALSQYEKLRMERR